MNNLIFIDYKSRYKKQKGFINESQTRWNFIKTHTTISSEHEPRDLPSTGTAGSHLTQMIGILFY